MIIITIHFLPSLLPNSWWLPGYSQRIVSSLSLKLPCNIIDRNISMILPSQCIMYWCLFLNIPKAVNYCMMLWLTQNKYHVKLYHPNAIVYFPLVRCHGQAISPWRCSFPLISLLPTQEKNMWYLVNVHDTSHWEKPYKSISDQLQTFYIYDGKSWW